MKFYLLEAVDPKLRRARLVKLKAYSLRQRWLSNEYRTRGDRLDAKGIGHYVRGDDARLHDKTHAALKHSEKSRSLHAGNFVRSNQIVRRFRNRERIPGYKGSDREAKLKSFSQYNRKLFKKIKASAG